MTRHRLSVRTQGGRNAGHELTADAAVQITLTRQKDGSEPWVVIVAHDRSFVESIARTNVSRNEFEGLGFNPAILIQAPQDGEETRS